jgi:serine/threonine-protein kinase SRPK3
MGTEATGTQESNLDIPIITVSMDESAPKRVRFEVEELPAELGISKAEEDKELTSEDMTESSTRTADGGEEGEKVEEQNKSDGNDPPELRYMLPKLDDVENIEGYQLGGYHPVTIGDIIGGKYQVIHKLGFGGFATVWLARDTEAQQYVALKIIIADSSKDSEQRDLKALRHLERNVDRPGGNFIDIPIEDFWITGPNGKHLCIVSEVAGPSIAHLTRTYMKKISLQDVRRMALQLTQCLAFLHSDGVDIGHGDLTTSNVLLELGRLDHLPQEKLLGILGEPVAAKVRPYTNKTLEPGAPKFVYQPADLTKLSKFYTGNITIIDFGSSFSLYDIPEECGTPAQFCSPELILNNKNGGESDLWALACTIFEMRAGEPLFECLFRGEEDVLVSMTGVLGPLPEIYLCEEKWTWLQDETGDGEQQLEEKVLSIRGGGSEDEKSALYDLLQKVLRYEPEGRLTADEMLRHPWFSCNFQSNNYTKV